MSKTLEIIIKNCQLSGEKNSPYCISEFEHRLGIIFPTEYRNLLEVSNGAYGNIGEEYIDFWSIEEVEDFESDIGEESLNGLLPFASNGCGMAYAFNKNSKGVWLIPMDSLTFESSKKCSESFGGFILRLNNGESINYR